MVLTAICVEALRSYDLRLGSQVLRVLCYLRGAMTEEIWGAKLYLLDQQTECGSFGHDVFERRALEEARHAGGGVVSGAELTLAVTLDVVWTIATWARGDPLAGALW